MLGLRDYVVFKNEQLAEAGARSLIDTLGEILLVTTGATYNPNDSSTFSVISEQNWQKAILKMRLIPTIRLPMQIKTSVIKIK